MKWLIPLTRLVFYLRIYLESRLDIFEAPNNVQQLSISWIHFLYFPWAGRSGKAGRCTGKVSRFSRKPTLNRDRDSSKRHAVGHELTHSTIHTHALNHSLVHSLTRSSHSIISLGICPQRSRKSPRCHRCLGASRFTYRIMYMHSRRDRPTCFLQHILELSSISAAFRCTCASARTDTDAHASWMDAHT